MIISMLLAGFDYKWEISFNPRRIYKQTKKYLEKKKISGKKQTAEVIITEPSHYFWKIPAPWCAVGNWHAAGMTEEWK